jgi:hypothetical protein
MADFNFSSLIDSLNDKIAAGGPKIDFSTIADLPKTIDEARARRSQQELRDAFKGGVPTDASGQPDYGAMAKTLFQRGGFDQGVAASNLGIQRDQLKLGQQASERMGQIEGGGLPTNNLPPSTSRNASVPVARPIGGGQTTDGSSQPASSQSGQGGKATIMQVATAAGIPNDQLGPVSASLARQLGVEDPNAPLDMGDPRVRGVIVPALQQFKRMGVGQVVPDGQSPTPQVVPQQPAAPMPQPGLQAPTQPTVVAQAGPQPAPNPQQNQGTFGAPSAIATRGAIPTGTDPEIQKQIATYTSIASNPAYPKTVQEAAMARLKALQDQGQPTGPMKEYDLYRRQGGNLPFQDWQADTEQRKSAATEEAKASTTKYQALVDGGVKAQQEIPQLEMLQEQMNDPNFYSGAGERYNLMFKRMKAAVGMDPDAAVPQEFLRKATAASVLASFGALKGLGPIRVAEMNLAKQAAASPENSIPANKLLIEIQKRTYQRQGDIAEMAQNYKQSNGVLDAGFDKQVTAYFKAHPIFTDAEIKDYHKAINQPTAANSSSAAPSSQQQFSSPADVHAAVASGKLKSGDAFTAIVNGKPMTRYVP